MKRWMQKKAKKVLSEVLYSVKLTRLKFPAMLNSKEFNMARKRRLANVSRDIQSGDLLHYCPDSLSKELYDFGLVLEVIPVNNYRPNQMPNAVALSSTDERQFKVLWQSDNCVSTLSSAYMNHSLLTKKIIICKS